MHVEPERWWPVLSWEWFYLFAMKIPKLFFLQYLSHIWLSCLQSSPPYLSASSSTWLFEGGDGNCFINTLSIDSESPGKPFPLTLQIFSEVTHKSSSPMGQLHCNPGCWERLFLSIVVQRWRYVLPSHAELQAGSGEGHIISWQSSLTEFL